MPKQVKAKPKVKRLARKPKTIANNDSTRPESMVNTTISTTSVSINSSEEISTFVFMGLVGTGQMLIRPRILELSMFAVRRSDVLLMPKQGSPRTGSRITLTFHPQRSIPIRIMQESGIF